MSLRPTTGHMRSNSDRAEWWIKLHGSLDVPLRSPLPYVNATPTGTPEEYYQIDIDRLTDEQIDAIAAFMAEKFSQPIDHVRAAIHQDHGVPIRASELEDVSFDGRLLL